MKAIFINPDNRSIERIDIGGREDIASIIGFDTIESDEVGKEGDLLFFDEECFLRGSGARFQLDSIVPVSGKALIVGTADGGNALRDAETDMDSLRSRIKYL